MTSATRVLRDFDLASPAEREDIIRGLVNRISVDEAECLAKACHKHDIFGHDRMPLELRLMIVQHLDIIDIYNCALLVCHKWSSLFMESEGMANDVLQKWFPSLYDRTMPGQDMVEMFAQIIVKRYLRDTGRFQTRLTYRFITNSNSGRHIVRIEGLRQGHTFKDLRCPVSLPSSMPTSSIPPLSATHPAGPVTAAQQSIQTPETDGSTVGRYLYSDQRLAWDLNGGDPGSSVIYFHDLHSLHAQQPRVFQLPGQQINGISLRVQALGDELIVATDVRRRTLYAWDIETQTHDSITLPAQVKNCSSRGRSVIISTIQGDLLLWTFLRGVVELDMDTMPQSPEAYCGPSDGQTVPCLPPTKQQVRQSRHIFHPQDSKVFFVVTGGLSAQPGWLRIYEYRDKLCSRVFTYIFACPFGILTHKSSNWAGLDRYTFLADKVDAHGTYMMLKFDGHFNGTYRMFCVMFNILSTSFSSLSFAPCPGYTIQSKQPNFLWNGQLCLRAGHLHDNQFTVQRSLEAGREAKRKRPGTTTGREEEQDERQLTAIQEDMLTGALKQPPGPNRLFYGDAGQIPMARRDIVRDQDISRAYPRAPDCHSEWDLLYMCSLYGGECSSAEPHVKDCTRLSPTSSSGGTAPPKPRPERRPIGFPQTFARVDKEALGDNEAEAIFGDEDLFIVVTTGGFYIVCAVDADRKMAKALVQDLDDDSEDKMDNQV